MKTEEKVKCPYEKKCGGCKYQGIPYEKQLKEKEKKERTVIHLYIKENDTHHYYGSIANVFEYFSPNILGISYGSLRNYGLSNEKTFQNSKCIIRKGTLLSKSGNRGKK